MVAEQYREVEERVTKACERAGRKREEVTLIAVSKTKPISMLKEAYEAGARTFGENKVQELVSKMDSEELASDISWQMIGHLQRNKVKYIVGRVDLIHSVDSFRLAEEINVQSKKKGVITPILIEVNAANEDTKFGVKIEDTIELIKQIAKDNSIEFSSFNYDYDYIGLDFATDFNDASHLNYSGSCKFSEYLAKEILKRFQITDRRGNDHYESWNRNVDTIKQFMKSHTQPLIN
jgi:hypothetical protein